MTFEPAVIARLVTIEFVAALAVFPVLFLVPAPYGRYQRRGFGPLMNARLGWVIMEFPAVVVPVWAFLAAGGGGACGGAAWLLLSLWLLHYTQRTFLFPVLMRGQGGRSPVMTVALAIVFNCLNGIVNGTSLAWLGLDPARCAAFPPRLLVGVAIFLAGFLVNLHADHVLRTLRAPGETGYRIPTGGAFRWVSAANYFGELVEWTGFAVAAMTPAAWAFAAFTAANLVPRAWSHHRWYTRTFPEYPPERRAIIPLIF
jgi:3-oxo-5-alpha-steroid 4-dehydrogenase 1